MPETSKRVVLRCPVRACAEALRPSGARWTCGSGHSFDTHRSGYLNLLQSQDRKSANPGDSREAIDARRRLSALGIGDRLHASIEAAVAARVHGRGAVLDVGCGEGALLRALSRLKGLELHGVDLASRALELAAKSLSSALFVVTNADRALPYADGSFEVIVSVDARTNAPEFKRILKPGGLVLVAVPAKDDLVELREAVKGARVERSRSERVERELASVFRLSGRGPVAERRAVAAPTLRDLLAATYRGARAAERQAVQNLQPMTVTLSHEILSFEPA